MGAWARHLLQNGDNVGHRRVVQLLADAAQVDIPAAPQLNFVQGAVLVAVVVVRVLHVDDLFDLARPVDECGLQALQQVLLLRCAYGILQPILHRDVQLRLALGLQRERHAKRPAAHKLAAGMEGDGWWGITSKTVSVRLAMNLCSWLTKSFFTVSGHAPVLCTIGTYRYSMRCSSPSSANGVFICCELDAVMSCAQHGISREAAKWLALECARAAG